MDKAEAIERLEYLKIKAQIALEQEVPEWIAEDVLGTIEAYDMAIEALEQTENSSEKPNNYCDDCLYTDTCDSKEFFYACTSKATISKMEQVGKE